ncbi:hypothetical protein AWB75_07204 [Caballeronia catudaia]|uniref:Uncharacterized protein n=1 Tax=Caballeronia catudaia TaxID=1777136 RepID=A0A158DVL0_9BURK|nr:hypothetical protein AWB75_07204 [Caballeronia catudaia]
MFDERLGDGFTVLAVKLDQHHIACVSLYKRCNLTVTAAAQEVAFPVPRNGAVLNRSGTFADRNSVADTTVILGLLRVMT